MRTPPKYEEMIRAVIRTASEHGFYYSHDTLTDHPACLPEKGHTFRVCVFLSRTADDFTEDAPEIIK